MLSLCPSPDGILQETIKIEIIYLVWDQDLLVRKFNLSSETFVKFLKNYPKTTERQRVVLGG